MFVSFLIVLFIFGKNKFVNKMNSFLFCFQVNYYSCEQKCSRERIHKWNAEQRLICDLLDNYQVKWGRPVRNMSEDVEVRFGLQLIHISDLVGIS